MYHPQDNTHDDALDRLAETYQVHMTPAQALRLVITKKESKFSWHQLYLNMVAVRDAVSGSEAQVLENIVQYAALALRGLLMAKLDPRRLDHLRHAEELAKFARMYEAGGANGGAKPHPHVGHIGGKPKEKKKFGGRRHVVTLSEVYYAPQLSHNLISNCVLDQKGYELRRIDGQRYLADSLTNGEAHTPTTNPDLSAFAVNEALYEVQEASLHDFHVRLGHLCSETIERLAKNPSSGIKLTDHLRPNCAACSHGKQTKNPQPKADSGVNAPIDRIGGVVCSDLKGRRILKYLKGTTTIQLQFKPAVQLDSKSVNVEDYSDADFAADKNTKAEFAAAAHCAREMLGVRELLEEIGVQVNAPMILWMDNQAAKRQVEGEETSGRAKHIDVKIKFVSDCTKKGIIKPRYVRSEAMPADLLMKSLPAPRVQALRELIHLRETT
ncbi:TPA: hypothetical protein N0F65_007267 [Lagenidium giganteum]|uniref:GAG-pre-integrase domain-containing protein n=1 Tax=Lagenidium giganteum TaxID=4803 RepID=A0AAV2YX99_9STRA|nr:TPA: hypothetical protein N0F65_007267 [Lagenidium giganteum]